MPNVDTGFCVGFEGVEDASGAKIGLNSPSSCSIDGLGFGVLSGIELGAALDVLCDSAVEASDGFDGSEDEDHHFIVALSRSFLSKVQL